MSDAFRIRSADGLSLEATIDQPYDPRAALVLCHPHPKMGGTMNAPLLVALVQELVRRGWAVLRFNFRGIGASEGEPGTGIDEVADAEGAVAEMRSRHDLPLAIAGWSFGGAVAIRCAAAHNDLVAVVGIAPAVVAKPGITAGLPDPDEISLSAPLLLVVGANDDLVDPADAKRWAEAQDGSLVEIPAANHFFWAKYDKLSAAVGDFLDGTIRS